ncbi:MAG: hypothetical protein HY074_03860 [Deltaproteobacteria bacterium]|nr:hypothetical protein [Deltaproteobacteria bacterium]
MDANEARELAGCFSGQRPPYLVSLRYSGLSAASTSKALDNACNELNEPSLQDRQSLGAKAVSTFGVVFGTTVNADIPTVLSEMFGTSQTRKDFEDKLADIGKIQDRFVRIRKVYELVVASQGKYDDGNTFRIMTPSRLLEDAKAGRAAGVCRDFSKLLEWSLLKVNRSPAIAEPLKSFGGLDEDSFFASQVVDVGAGHAWVDIDLPVGMGDKQVFYKISLDTTFYDAYTPLFHRRQGLSQARRTEEKTECRAVQDCVQKVALKYLPKADALSPSPGAGYCTGG